MSSGLIIPLFSAKIEPGAAIDMTAPDFDVTQEKFPLVTYRLFQEVQQELSDYCCCRWDPPLVKAVSAIVQAHMGGRILVPGPHTE